MASYNFVSDPRLANGGSSTFTLGGGSSSSSSLSIGGGGMAGGLATPAAPTYNDPYTPQLMGYVDQMGKGAAQSINSSYDRNQGTLTGNLYSRGLGTSSLVDSFTLGNENSRQQSLLNLSDSLAQQRAQAVQAGSGLALQRYGTDMGAYTNLYDANLNAATSSQNAMLSAQSSRYATSANLAASMFRNNGLSGVGSTGMQGLAAGNVSQGASYPGSFLYA